MLDEVVQSDTERPFDNQREGKVMQRRGLLEAVNCGEGKEIKFPLGGAFHTVIIALCAFVLCGCPRQVQAQVPVTLAPVVKQQLFDQNGLVLSGGLVCTYQSGTTTPQATYTDSTGTVQNANPVVLDSSGRANIWLIGAAYKIVVAGGGSCASPSNLQYTVDGVPAGVFLNGNNSWTGNETHSGTETFTGPLVTNDGGTLNGTFAGNPNFSGTVTFSNNPIFSAGVTAPFFSSSATNQAATGVLRLASGDAVCWRNNANAADLCISKSVSDVFSLPALFLAAPPAIGGTTPGAIASTSLSATTNISFTEGSPAGATAGKDVCQGRTATGLQCSYNGGTFYGIPQIIYQNNIGGLFSGSISATTCATATTVAVTGIAGGDVVSWSYGSAPTASDGKLTLNVYVDSLGGNAGFQLCNPTAGSLTASGLPLSFVVIRGE